MNIHLRIIVILLLSIFRVDNDTYAQSIKSISGKVLFESNKPAFGNAIALSAVDSSILTGIAFWEGNFRIDDLDQPAVLLKVNSLEFEDQYRMINYTGEQFIDVGTIVVKETQNQLEDVVVSAEKPLTINRNDGSMEVEIKNTALATSTSVSEILQRSPSILVDEDNNYEVVGKGLAVIYLNGTRVDNERLSSLSPSEVLSIQVISNPGPKYDAEGNAVIDVVTIKKLEEGVSGTVKNYYTVNGFAGNNNRTNLSWRAVKNKWSFNGGYGIQVGDSRNIKRTTRTRDLPSEYFSSDLIIDWQNHYDNFSNYSLGTQYDLNNQSYLSFAYNGSYEKLGGSQWSKNVISYTENGEYESNILINNLDLKNTLNLNYSQTLDDAGSSLFFGSQYSNFQDDIHNFIVSKTRTDTFSETNNLNNSGKNKTEIASNQLDFTKSLKSITVESGLKYWFVSINSYTNFSDIQENGTEILDPQLSNDFKYTEKVGAAYVNVRGSINPQVSYSLGLRAETTKFILTSSANDGAQIDRSYSTIFPSATLNHTSKKGFEYYTSFSSRLNRPSYSLLNPFVIYQDQFTSIEGNPNLVPSSIYSVELGTIRNGWNLKLGYNHAREKILGGAFQSLEDSRSYVLQRYNISLERSYFLSLSKSITIGWWQSVNSFSTTFAQLRDNNELFGLRDERPYFYFYSQNSFKAGNLFKFYLTGSITSNRQDGIYLRKSYGFINIGVERKFLNDQLKVNMELNDVFYTIRADGEYELGDTYILYANQFSTNYFRFSLTLDLGKLSNTKFRNKRVGESETRRAN